MKLVEIISKEVIDDVRSAAWLESELYPQLDLHRRHEMADICEKGSIERVWRVMGISVAEVRMALTRILLRGSRVAPDNTLERPDRWKFRFVCGLSPSALAYIKEKIHEYLVARVMADRTAVIIPAATSVWEERAKMSLAALSNVASTIQLPHGPVRRPLWPLSK